MKDNVQQRACRPGMQVTSNVVAHPSASLAPQDFGVRIIEARPPNWLYDPIGNDNCGCYTLLIKYQVFVLHKKIKRYFKGAFA